MGGRRALPQINFYYHITAYPQGVLLYFNEFKALKLLLYILQLVYPFLRLSLSSYNQCLKWFGK
jgi:hypothetical protein